VHRKRHSLHLARLEQVVLIHRSAKDAVDHAATLPTHRWPD
jgi:hypothetical protein